MTGSRKVGDCNWRNMNRKLDDNEIHEKVGDASPPPRSSVQRERSARAD